MKLSTAIFLIFLFLINGFVVARMTYGLFNSLAYNNNNVISASSTFPTPISTNTPTPTPTSTITPTPTPIIANHIVISEVQITGGAGNTDNDFIELYNSTSLPFDLDGHRLVKRTASSSTDTSLKSWTSSTIIPAHGFYLWANSSIASLIGADASTSGTLTASNSAALRFGPENTGTIIDALSWNPASSSLKEGAEFPTNPGTNQSMERKAYSTSTPSSMSSGGLDELKGNGYDADDNSTDFILRATSQPQNSTSSTETP